MSPQVSVDRWLAPWTRFLRAHTAVTRKLSSRLESEHGLTLSDFDVLAQLHAAPEHALRRVDLARSVLLSASGITRLLEGLERCGWVEKRRCATDARVTYAALTHVGIEKFEAARATHVEDVEELFGSRFDDAELAVLAELLARLPLAESIACSE